MKQFVVTLVHLAVLLDVWCTVAVGGVKEKIKENDHLSKTNWKDGAKLIFTCDKKSNLVNGNERLDFKMECFELNKKHHPESGEKYAVHFVLGTCETDVFYSPSCDQKKIIMSFKFNAMTNRGECYGTYLVYNDEKDTEQIILYLQKGGPTDKNKLKPEAIKTHRPIFGYDFYKEEDCDFGKNTQHKENHKDQDHKEGVKKEEEHKDQDNK